MITRKRDIWCILSLMAVALFVLWNASCKKEDDEDDEKQSSIASKLVGSWLGVDKEETNTFYLSLVLRSDKSADYSQFYMTSSDFKSMIDQKGLTWGYKSSTNELTVYTSSTQGYVMKVSAPTQAATQAQATSALSAEAPASAPTPAAPTTSTIVRAVAVVLPAEALVRLTICSA